MHRIAVIDGLPLPSTTHSPMYGENLSLFSMNCGEKRAPVAVVDEVAHAIDHDQPAALVEIAGIAGQEPAVRGQRCARSRPAA